MDRSAIMWVGLIVAGLVFLDLLIVEVRRIVREAKRIVTRLTGYGDLPIVSMLAVATRDVERIGSASDEITALVGRGQAALATLRSYLPKGMSPG